MFPLAHCPLGTYLRFFPFLLLKILYMLNKLVAYSKVLHKAYQVLYLIAMSRISRVHLLHIPRDCMDSCVLFPIVRQHSTFGRSKSVSHKDVISG